MKLADSKREPAYRDRSLSQRSGKPPSKPARLRPDQTKFDKWLLDQQERDKSVVFVLRDDSQLVAKIVTVDRFMLEIRTNGSAVKRMWISKAEIVKVIGT
jgi:hypothetical protein